LYLMVFHPSPRPPLQNVLSMIHGNGATFMH
jgi:hypothetical protein